MLLINSKDSYIILILDTGTGSKYDSITYVYDGTCTCRSPSYYV